MHPAYSVILFTTASGAGYGLLFWLSLSRLVGVTHASWGFAIGLVVALGLITLGLLSSTFHLGHPERAWRALSQWRSSWLSREGVAAVATYIPAGLLTVLALFQVETWLGWPLALLAAIGAGVTVHCTGMIYASLRTVREWNLSMVPVIYLVLAAASGGLLFAMFAAFANGTGRGAAFLALLALLAAATLKTLYWRHIDGDPGQYTAAMALGMGDRGIRQIDPPHTRPNFVMREMGYDVARRHAEHLRRLAMIWGLCVPALLMLLIATTGWLSPVLAPIAVLSAAIGLFTERWLFFAEASHVSMLYYGMDRA